MHTDTISLTVPYLSINFNLTARYRPTKTSFTRVDKLNLQAYTVYTTESKTVKYSKKISGPSVPSVH